MPKTMRPQIGILALLTLLITISTPIPVNLWASFSSTQVLAQTPDARKAEADRLNEQGIQQYSISQFEAALQSWQQALMIYREIKDRKGEGASLGNLGLANYSLGNYAKAIEYQQQRLAIAKSIKDRLGEGQSLSNLGGAYVSLEKFWSLVRKQKELSHF
jgi:tetratricopeptide (TPR) repeat protein